MTTKDRQVTGADPRRELERLLAILSEFECAQLVRLFDDVSVGRRYWEDEISTLYNERVKFRSLQRADGSGPPIPAAPETEFGIFAPIPITKPIRATKRIVLPESVPVGMSVGEALGRRRSRRDYVPATMPIGLLATVLGNAAGVTGHTQGYGYDRLPLRTFPSSGGLQVPELYVSVQSVEGVPPGLYHFDPSDHALSLLRPGNHGGFLKMACLGQPQLETAAAVVIVTGCFDRLRWKYGERAYRYMCMDIGYLGQNLYLVGEALGLGVCAIAGFMDDALEQFLGVDGHDEIPLLLTTIGILA
jgi:SagB-type dehydrogenase family enzyme